MAKKQSTPGQLQRTLTALAASILVFYLWIFVYQRFFVTHPAPQTQPAATATETAPALVPTTEPEMLPTTRPSTTGSTQPTAEMAGTAPAATAGLPVVGGHDPTDVKLGNAAKGNPFPMALDLSPKGASIKEAWLRGYYETVKKEEPYVIFKPLIDGVDIYSLETPKIHFPDLNQDARLDSVIWKKEQVSSEQVTFSVLIKQPDGKPLARVFKTYTLHPQPPKKLNVGETHDMLMSLRLENLTGSPLRAVVVQQGPVGFQQQDTKSEDRELVVAMWDKSREGRAPTVKRHYRKEIKEGELLLGRDEEGRRIAWLAEANQYFTCIMTPQGRTGPNDAARFEKVDAVRLTDRPEAEYTADPSLRYDMSFRYVTTPLVIAPGASQDVGFDCYIGPKSKTIFQTVEAYKALSYWSVMTVNFYACAPTALISVMMSMLNAFHRIPPHNYGISIFLLVVIVRLILHPITKRSQVNMMKMQKQMASMQPKIQAVKEKYANDKAMLNQETMKVYQEAGVNPAGSVLSCIPMMLQIPIWAALWQALSSTVEMRHAPLDGWWIKDLSQPDALFALPPSMHFVIPVLGIPIVAINLLPMLLAISQLLQAKYMPRTSAPSTSDKPDQMDQQRKMMMFMSLFFFFMFYNMPSGLNFYIMCSNIAGIIEQKRIRDHIADEEKRGGFTPKPGKKGGLFSKLTDYFQGKWDQLQKEAEEAKRLPGKKKK